MQRSVGPDHIHRTRSVRPDHINRTRVAERLRIHDHVHATSRSAKKESQSYPVLLSRKHSLKRKGKQKKKKVIMSDSCTRLGKPFSLFHFILFFRLFQSSKSFHFISLFSIIFFNFSNLYTIFLNLNHLYHLEICKIKLFFKLFFKPFRMIKNDQNNFPKHMNGVLLYQLHSILGKITLGKGVNSLRRHNKPNYICT